MTPSAFRSSSMMATQASAVAAAEDATMRNAIAFLTQPDSASALVFALVHDPEFRLAAALTTSASVVHVQGVRALLRVFDAHEDQLRCFVGLLMLREMVETVNWNELFRANSSTTAIIREYTCDLGAEFLQHALQDVLAELWDAPTAYEVNPRLVSSMDELAGNQQRLEALATRLLERIFDSATLFPYQIAKIYRVMELEMTRLIDRDRKSNLSLQRLSAISEDTLVDDLRRSNASLPRLSAISEDVLQDEYLSQRGSTSSGCGSAGIGAAKEEFFIHLGGFLFLRFLCPALLMPHKMGLSPTGEPPAKHTQRTLVLLAKLFQSLANNVEYGSRERFMVPFNAFLTQNRPKLFKFYDQICQQALNDNRRESLIMRSNITPRISQLFGTSGSASASSSSSSSTGLLGGQPFVHSVEEALVVIQQWMRESVDMLVAEVGSNGKSKRKSIAEHGPNGSMSPVKKKTKSPKRKLKTSKTLSPIPYAVDDDTDSVHTDHSNSHSSHDASSGPVTPEEFDRVVGHTTHRDIQLMKIYYSNLSRNGLQRLLDANREDPDSAEWTLYRSRNDVDVFRRNPPKSCGLAIKTDKERFVEMKAHVEIQATPRQVYKYLRSLEKMSEWDDRVANIRPVEPLDESKTVLYRSHPKLSLWPTWLVKPRDSCDLHSFVDKTGLPDTYAVLMESIPRPDVPQLKGTVRMSFATGGFLVEPAEDQCTKLTCVVKADFKGLLPRYLAESICFRQVLNVRAVKLRLETSNQHSDSSWV